MSKRNRLATAAATSNGMLWFGLAAFVGTIAVPLAAVAAFAGEWFQVVGWGMLTLATVGLLVMGLVEQKQCAPRGRSPPPCLGGAVANPVYKTPPHRAKTLERSARNSYLHLKLNEVSVGEVKSASTIGHLEGGAAGAFDEVATQGTETVISLPGSVSCNVTCAGVVVSPDPAAMPTRVGRRLCHGTVPLLRIVQVFVNRCPGSMRVPSGIVSSTKMLESVEASNAYGLPPAS